MIKDFSTWRSLTDLYAAYSACVDEGQFDAWPDFFVDDCRYRVVARENYDRGYPLSLMDFHGVGMLRDRVYAIQSTLFHAPYYQRHIVGLPLVTDHQGDIVTCEANYLVIRTKRDAPGEIFNAGRYLDRIQLAAEGAKLIERTCVYDTDLIPNSVIYPI
jgi:salicylate 5-hydroxylase small subunit